MNHLVSLDSENDAKLEKSMDIIKKRQHGHSATGIIMSKSKDELEKHIAELSK